MFSGVDFDGSLIVPEEMPASFIETMIQAAPITLLGDPPRLPGGPQEIIPPQFYETISNQTGDVRPGSGMEYAVDDDDEEEDIYEEEDFDLTEAEIEALLELETAAGSDDSGPTQAYGQIIDVNYTPTDTPVNGPAAPPPTPLIPAPAENQATPDAIVVEVIEGNGSTLIDVVIPDEEDGPQGDIVFDPGGTIEYIPAAGEGGEVEITYTIEDEQGETTTDTLVITIEDSEPEVTATNSETSGGLTASGFITTDFGDDEEGSSLYLEAEGATWDTETSTLTANDKSWYAALTETGYTFTQTETLTDAAQTIPGQEIPITITAYAVDGDGDIATSDFTVLVTDVGPTASDCTLCQQTENATVTYNVLSSDADAGVFGGSLIAATIAPDCDATGTITFSQEGTITYTPTQGESGTVVIDYTVMDVDGDTATAQMSIDIHEDSQPVIASTDTLADEADDFGFATGAISFDFGADSEGATIELSAENATWNGNTATLTADDISWMIELADAEYTFTQLAPFDNSENDTTTIDVTLIATNGDGTVATDTFTISVEDDQPTAENVSITSAMTEDAAVSYNVITNGHVDFGADGGTLTDATLTENSLHSGQVDYASDGTVTYTPIHGETGTVIIDYTVTDSDGDAFTAQLSFDLASDSEPSIFVTSASGDEGDMYATATGTIDVDFGADAEGALVALSATGATWNTTTRTLTADDSSWQIVLTAIGYEFTQFTPMDHSDDDPYIIDVTLTATDGDETSTTTGFTVSVTDDGPTANDVIFTATTDEDALVNYNVFGNGDVTTGADGGVLSDAYLAEGSLFGGLVSHEEDGTITYTPVQGESGTVAMEYTVIDGDGDTASATLSVVLPNDSEPSITADDSSGDESGGLVTSTGTLSIDYGEDSTGSSYALSAEGATWNASTNTLEADDNSWAIEVAAGMYTFTQLTPFIHSDNTDPNDTLAIDVTVTAEDGDGSITTDYFTVSVNDDGPSAQAVSLTQTTFGDAISYNVLTSGDATTGIDGGTLIGASLESESTYTGTVTHNSDGTVTYTPDENETGTVVINYAISDGDGDTVTDHISIDLATPPATNDIGVEDVMNGSGGEVITGTDGNDTLDGGQGRDVIFGTAGDDHLIGGNSKDAIFGGTGDDLITAGGGNDSLTGGLGDDTLTGGKGGDTFIFTSPDDGTDIITDFDSSRDEIALYEATFDLMFDDKSNLNPDQFTSVVATSFSGGYDFTDATSGIIYASDTDSDIGSLYYDPNDVVDGDEFLLAVITEDDGDDLDATNFEFLS